MNDRTNHKRSCIKCSRVSWTTMKLSKPYTCASCRRAAGESGTGKRGEGYSSLAIKSVPVVSVGFCPSCKRNGQQLINGRCACCIFYDDSHDVDSDLSARAKRGKGGVNDFVRNPKA